VPFRNGESAITAQKNRVPWKGRGAVSRISVIVAIKPDVARASKLFVLNSFQPKTTSLLRSLGEGGWRGACAKRKRGRPSGPRRRAQPGEGHLLTLNRPAIHKIVRIPGTASSDLIYAIDNLSP